MDAPLLLHYNRLFRKREVVLYAIVLRIWSMLDKGAHPINSGERKYYA